MAKAQKPISDAEMRRIERRFSVQEQQRQRMRGKFAKLDVSNQAIAVIVMLYGILWLVVGFSIPYYRETGGLYPICGVAGFLIAVGLLLLRFYRD